MKKTVQTLMTAAVFAAALGAGASDTLSSAQSISYGSEADFLGGTVTTMLPQPVYGPPEVMLTSEEPEQTLVPDGTAPFYPETTTESTSTLALAGTSVIPIATTLGLAGTAPVPQDTSTTCCTTLGIDGTAPIPEGELVTGGVMPIYQEPGDTNQDGSLDARDVSLLKQYLLANGDIQSNPDNLDVNRDGNVDKQDVKALIRLLTGKPEDEDEPQQTDQTAYPVTSTTTTFVTTCPLYGPPPAWN